MVIPAGSKPFAQLELSADEQQHLRATAATLLDAVQAKYEQFLDREGAAVAPAQWELLRELEDMRVFRDRRPGAGTDNKQMHALLTFGSIVGTLSDVVYGVLSPTTDVLRVKSAYLDDTVCDCGVIAALCDPTLEHPLQSLTVRWFVRTVPLHMRIAAKKRDAVFLESVGMRQLTNGERVGCRLMHSVSFAATPPIPGYARFNLSSCTFYRELPSRQRVQVYAITHVDISDKSWVVSTTLKGIASTLVGVARAVECSELKKLTWLIQRRAASTSSTAASDSSFGSGQPAGCSVCGSDARSASKGTKSACAICCKPACKTCRVKRELCVAASDGQICKQRTRFCISCIAKARLLDATIVAADEAQHRPACGAALGHRVQSVSQVSSSSSDGPTSMPSGNR